MLYEGRLYRPPSEARSLIIQATIGCPYNTCTFCSMYKGEPFKIKPMDRIESDLKYCRDIYSYVERIFFADGDCMYMDTDDLCNMFDMARRIFPEVKRIGIYATTQSILKKTPEELKRLYEHGLKIVYLGIESGSEKVLKRIRKNVSPDEIIKSGLMIKESGIKLSVTFISGLGSEELSYEHAVESARVINAIEPDYIGLLTLLLEEHAPLYKEILNKTFRYLTPHEVLEETRVMVEHINVKSGMFRSNHASNYVSLRGVFPDDKENILAMIDRGLKISDSLYNQKYRGL